MSVYNHRPSVNLNQLVTNIPVRRKAADQVERDKFEWSQVKNSFLPYFLFSYKSVFYFFSGKVHPKLSTVLNLRLKKNMCEVRNFLMNYFE